MPMTTTERTRKHRQKKTDVLLAWRRADHRCAVCKESLTLDRDRMLTKDCWNRQCKGQWKQRLTYEGPVN